MSNHEPNNAGPLLNRYRNDVQFFNLVEYIRHAAVEAKLTEQIWRDAVQLAFELERRRGESGGRSTAKMSLHAAARRIAGGL